LVVLFTVFASCHANTKNDRYTVYTETSAEYLSTETLTTFWTCRSVHFGTKNYLSASLVK